MEKSPLIITPFFSPNTGGVETHLDDLCAALAERNLKTYVITYQPLTSKTMGKSLERRGSVTIIRIKWWGHNLFHKLERYPLLELVYLFPGIFLKSFFFMIRNKNEIGIIHSHGLVASLVARILKFFFKKKVIASTHAIYNFSHRPLLGMVTKHIFASFDRVLAISKQSKKELIRIGINEDKITTYRYWVNQEIFKPIDKIECKRKLGWQEKFIVLFVGRLLKIKGLELLIEAARRLKGNIHIAIVGDGPLEARMAKEARINSRLIFVGRIANEFLVTYYNAADIVIVPSIYEEAYGRIILEALSCGTPVIASRRGGITEALSPEAGILIEPTVEEIINSINLLYQNEEKRKSMGSSASLYALENFGKKNADIIISSY